MLHDFCQDLSFSLRTLMRRSPGFTAIALLSIALGVAALTVVYTAVKAVIINPLPYTHSGELVQFRSEFGNLPESEQSHTDWIFWNDAQEIIRRNRTLQSAGVYGNSVVNLAGNSIPPPEALYGLRISAGLFPTLGVQQLAFASPSEQHPATFIALSFARDSCR